MEPRNALFVHIGPTWTQLYYESLTVVPTDDEWNVDDIVSMLGDFQFLGTRIIEHVVISSRVSSVASVFANYAKKVLKLEPVFISPRHSLFAMDDDIPTDVVGVTHSHPGEVVYVGLDEAITISYVKDGLFQGYFQGPALTLSPSTQMPARIHLGKAPSSASIQGQIVSIIGTMDTALRTMRPHQEAKIVLYGPLAKWMSGYVEERHTLDSDALFSGLQNLLKHAL
jgi:pantothenate kinase type III